MKKILVFRHVPFEGPGYIGSALEERSVGFDFADLYRPGAPVPQLASYDGIVVLGGPMSANDPLPFLDKERTLIAGVLERQQPLLGVCLGSQLIARVLGADVRRNPRKEIGWFPLHFTESARKEGIFEGLPSSETVFHWHGDTWDLPAGAIHLAWSEACQNQAFRHGSKVYGLQFHLEITPEMIADWQQQDENCGDCRELAAPLDPHVNAGRMEELATQVFGRWCELL